jgi:hypothetical protein
MAGEHVRCTRTRSNDSDEADGTVGVVPTVLFRAFQKSTVFEKVTKHWETVAKGNVFEKVPKHREAIAEVNVFDRIAEPLPGVLE